MCKSEIKNNHTIKQFFSLLRAALWKRSVEQFLFEKQTADWDELKRLAEKQTVLPLLYTSAETLPIDLRPSKEWFRAIYPFVLRTQQGNLLINKTLEKAVLALQDSGVKPTLLKGAAYAQYYAIPELRQCGDIDLYTGGGYSKALDTAHVQGWNGSSVETIKHSSFTLDGVHIEIHRMAAILPRYLANRRFQEWTVKQLSSSTRSLQAGSAEVSLPSPIFDAVFVFIHLYHHFINGGIGLRQLCDWAMILHTHRRIINRTELKVQLKRFGLLRAWKMFGYIAVHRIGLPSEEFPFYDKSYEAKGNKILAFILNEGNFGHSTPRMAQRPDGYFAGKLHALRHSQQRLLLLFPIIPIDATLTMLQHLVIGVRQVIIDKLCKQRKEN